MRTTVATERRGDIDPWWRRGVATTGAENGDSQSANSSLGGVRETLCMCVREGSYQKWGPFPGREGRQRILQKGSVIGAKSFARETRQFVLVVHSDPATIKAPPYTRFLTRNKPCKLFLNCNIYFLSLTSFDFRDFSGFESQTSSRRTFKIIRVIYCLYLFDNDKGGWCVIELRNSVNGYGTIFCHSESQKKYKWNQMSVACCVQ